MQTNLRKMSIYRSAETIQEWIESHKGADKNISSKNWKYYFDESRKLEDREFNALETSKKFLVEMVKYRR